MKLPLLSKVEAFSEISSFTKRFLRQPTLLIASFDFGLEDAISFEDPLASLPLVT